MGAVTDKPTDTDPTVKTSWAIDDEVTRLREWASDHSHELRTAVMTIGSARECELRLRDNSGQVSRRHAQLVAHGAAWKIRDLESKNGLWRDGFRSLDFTLAPGIVIGIGSLRLVAESSRFIALRRFVSRLLGWVEQTRVDEALTSLRLCGARQSSLVLVGEGDLAPIARKLHDATLAADAPFVIYDRDRGDETLAAAGPGTLCIIAPGGRQLPRDIASVTARLRSGESLARLVVCAPTAAVASPLCAELVRASHIEVPTITVRAHERERIILESADDAVRELGAASTGFMMNDLDRLVALEFAGMSELDETVRRLISVRTWGLVAGAARVGIAHSSLSKWLERRGLHT